MTNFDEWDVDLRRAAQALVPGAILMLQRKLVFLTLGAAVEIAPGRFRRISGVVLLTPVDTGRTRSSWSVSRGQPAPSPRGGASRPPVDAMQATSAMQGMGPYETVWIASSVPWIHVLEYGGYPQTPRRGSWDKQAKRWVIKSAGGFSRQAPRGMVRITVAAVKAALEGG